MASNHNYAPFAIVPGSDSVGEVVVKGNIISKNASDGSEGESLFGDGKILKSLTVGGNIEMQGSRLRFHTLNVKVDGVINYTGGKLNLCYGSANAQNLSFSFGGLNGTNREINIGGNPSSGHMHRKLDYYNDIYKFRNLKIQRDKFTYESADSVGVNTYNLVMNGTSTGVQYYEDTGTTDILF